MKEFQNRIKIIKGVGIDGNKLNETTASMIKIKYGNKCEEINHNNYSIELKYFNLGMSFNYKINDPEKFIYYMGVDGEVDAETDDGLIFDKNTTLEDVISFYGYVEPRGTDSSELAFFEFFGILFYVNEMEVLLLPHKKVKIHKIRVVKNFK